MEIANQNNEEPQNIIENNTQLVQNSNKIGNPQENDLQNNNLEYGDEEEGEEGESCEEYFQEKLPLVAQEYYKLKNEVDILKKQKQYLQNTMPDYKIKTVKTNKKDPFKEGGYNGYKNYEKKILNEMMDEEIFPGVGTTKDILGGFVDRVLERSLYLYKNRNCLTCSKLLSQGKSTQKCPKCHHLLKGYDKNKKK